MTERQQAENHGHNPFPLRVHTFDNYRSISGSFYSPPGHPHDTETYHILLPNNIPMALFAVEVSYLSIQPMPPTHRQVPTADWLRGRHDDVATSFLIELAENITQAYETNGTVEDILSHRHLPAFQSTRRCRARCSPSIP